MHGASLLARRPQISIPYKERVRRVRYGTSLMARGPQPVLADRERLALPAGLHAHRRDKPRAAGASIRVFPCKLC